MSSAFHAVDSWAVRSGRAIGLQRHRRRFVTACADIADPDAAGSFFDRAAAAVPREGSWWPRVELGDDGALTSRLRPLPAASGPLTVAVHQGDPRTAPRRKGPDLDVLGRLRAGSQAGELLLTADDGVVLEGATTSLLWWDDGALCRVDPALPVLGGVTASVLTDRAAAQGIAVQNRRAAVRDLVGREVWFVNAVHGIRPAAEWADGAAAGAPIRAAEWQEWLAAQTELLTPTRAADDA